MYNLTVLERKKEKPILQSHLFEKLFIFMIIA